MASQFKTPSKMCRHGTREDCPISNCRFQHSTPNHVFYSTALKGAVPPPPTPHADWCGNGKVYAQHIRPSVEDAVLAPGPRDINSSAATPSDTIDANALAQGSYFLTARASICLRHKIFWATADIIAATDGLALYRVWLESQVEVQKARIQAMSKHNLAKNFRGQQPEVPSTPLTPRLGHTQPFPMHIPKSASATGRCEHEVPVSATPPGAVSTYTHEVPNSSITAPRKVDMSYKTTPCRHFTLNRGWCPWGDDCCFIHDSELEWAPAPDRGSSGRSTPSSTTLVGNNYKPLHNGTTTSVAEPGTAVRSSSSQSAHCWGYIQGLCPHSGDNCKFIHPADIVPYIKYTPCLTWPRCGYPTQVCPLKHPQVDKLPMSQPRGRPSVTHGTAPVGPQPQTAFVRAPYAGEQPCPRAFPITADPTSLYGAVPFVEASSHIIPHDAAYASAVRYHNPVQPSAETFSPPPRVAVRLSRPSDDAGHSGRVSADKYAVPGDFGLCGVHQGRRRVSIAVQRPDAELVSGVPGRTKEYVRGHGRGKSMHL
ncbi:hypothetical protein EDB92DRAFT_1875613 [Lactarius akahatsu]|uniref:C3H1-type domain-containing protein n=1 Tax=Lactarius akahatsu TaxID=416441 RepID=A0AAD4QBM5_9AGAM|nr:hypothetical protein EDB92DRAFT_1875613 [Lactarius akahatsu]